MGVDGCVVVVGGGGGAAAGLCGDAGGGARSGRQTPRQVILDAASRVDCGATGPMKAEAAAVETKSIVGA